MRGINRGPRAPVSYQPISNGSAGSKPAPKPSLETEILVMNGIPCFAYCCIIVWAGWEQEDTNLPWYAYPTYEPVLISSNVKFEWITLVYVGVMALYHFLALLCFRRIANWLTTPGKAVKANRMHWIAYALAFPFQIVQLCFMVGMLSVQEQFLIGTVAMGYAIAWLDIENKRTENEAWKAAATEKAIAEKLHSARVGNTSCATSANTDCESDSDDDDSGSGDNNNNNKKQAPIADRVIKKLAFVEVFLPILFWAVIWGVLAAYINHLYTVEASGPEKYVWGVFFAELFLSCHPFVELLVSWCNCRPENVSARPRTREWQFIIMCLVSMFVQVLGIFLGVRYDSPLGEYSIKPFASLGDVMCSCTMVNGTCINGAA